MRMLCLSGLVLVSLLSGVALTGQSHPNVLFIIGDDMGLETIGAYGSPAAPPTPNLDALAAGGVRFNLAIMNPACSPTRGALLTGRYGIHNGVATTVGPGDLGVNTDETTLPAVLAASVYSSALIGKWHLGARWGLASPNVYGWPHFAGIMDGGLVDYYDWQKVVDGQVVQVTRYATTELVDDAIAWIGTQTGPWMLQLALNAPHAPFQAPPRNLHTRDLSGLNPQTDPRPFYLAMVEAMDTEIGRLLAALPPAVRANTDIIFLGDNGTDGAVVAPPVSPMRAKGSLYDRGSHVPMIVQGPSVATPGAVSDALVSAVDLFPTILELCGTPLPGSIATHPLDGVSILSLLQGTASSVRDHVYYDMANSLAGGGYGVRDDRYELLRIQNQLPAHMELYDLVADPMETHDLLGGPLSGTEAARFQRFLGLLDTIRPDGWSEVFGTGCPGNAGVPRMGAQTPPTVGQLFFYRCDDRPNGCGLCVTVAGFSNTVSHGVPLPAPLESVGMPGCSLLVDPVGYPGMGADGLGVISIPNFPVYSGISFYLQTLLNDPQTNGGIFVASSGLHAIIGS